MSVPTETVFKGLDFLDRGFSKRPLTTIVIVLLLALAGAVYVIVQQQVRIDELNEKRIEAEADKRRIANELYQDHLQVAWEMAGLRKELEELRKKKESKQ